MNEPIATPVNATPVTNEANVTAARVTIVNEPFVTPDPVVPVTETHVTVVEPKPDGVETLFVDVNETKTNRYAAKRTLAQREADLELIEELLAKQRRQKDILEQLNGSRPYKISRTQLIFDINFIQTRMKQHWSKKSIKTCRGFSVARIETFQREIWDAWMQSQEPQQSTEEVKTGTAGGDGSLKPSRLKRKVTKSFGSAKLAMAWVALEELRVKLEGTASPIQIEGKVEHEHGINTEQLSHMRASYLKSLEARKGLPSNVIDIDATKSAA